MGVPSKIYANKRLLEQPWNKYMLNHRPVTAPTNKQLLGGGDILSYGIHIKARKQSWNLSITTSSSYFLHWQV
jgi:hypothetical protein